MISTPLNLCVALMILARIALCCRLEHGMLLVMSVPIELMFTATKLELWDILWAKIR